MIRVYRTFAAAALLFALAAPAFCQDTGQLLNELTALRQKYPAVMTRVQAAEMLNAFALAHPGWGMLKKGSGNSCPIRDTFISCDILIYEPTITHYDVASGADFDADAGTSNMKPTWNSDGPCVLGPSSGCAMSNFLKPFPAGPILPPILPPNGTPTTTAIPPALQDFMNAVAGALDSMQGKLDHIGATADAIQPRLDGIQQQVAALPAQITVPALGKLAFPVYKGNIFGQAFTLTPQKP